MPKRKDQSTGASFATLLAFAHDLADMSGAAILPLYRNDVSVENKHALAGKAGFDPVTAADRAAEEVIRAALSQRFPGHSVIGEEYADTAGADDYRWIIDPIDGTRSFLMGFPTWGTLIGLYRGQEPVLGIMNQPATRERFYSTQDGAFAATAGSERRITTRPCPRIEDAVVSTTHPDLFGDGRAWERFLGIKARARMTRYGGDCYGYCMLASGRIDAIIETGLKSFDVAALVPIIERAGGRITTWDGGPAGGGGSIVAAGDPHLHEHVLELLQG
jgi:myo-inositol-1(or 4)-monophosphatase